MTPDKQKQLEQAGWAMGEETLLRPLATFTDAPSLFPYAPRPWPWWSRPLLLFRPMMVASDSGYRYVATVRFKKLFGRLFVYRTDVYKEPE